MIHLIGVISLKPKLAITIIQRNEAAADDRQMKKAQHHVEVIHQVKQDWPDKRANKFQKIIKKRETSHDSVRR